jgi:predicted Zn finger-like uncharacterized protein
MAVRATCDNCGYKYKLKDELAGRKVKCKICQHVFALPKLPPEGVEVSKGGSLMYRYEERKREFEMAIGDEQTIEAIGEHISQHLGKVDMVWHELISDLVHIDVHMIEPTDERPFYTLVTSGMSDRPMTVPPECEHLRYAELMLSLPPDWQMTQEAFEDDANYWPMRLLKMLARFPHEYETGLGWGHTIPNGDPPEPFSDNTAFCCALLLSPVLVPDGFDQLKIDEERTVHFYSLVPIYREEMDFKLKKGTDALIERFAANEVSELLDLSRVNVCKKKGWW